MPTYNSGLWGSTYAPINAKSTMRKRIARLMQARQLRDERQLIRTLLGVVAGSTATINNVRVAHSLVELGGKRTYQNEVLVNRATTAADVTDLNANLFAYSSRPAAYPRDRATRA